MHTGYRPFQCDQCSAQFKRSNELKRHAKSHAWNAKKVATEGAGKESRPALYDNSQTLVCSSSSEASAGASGAITGVVPSSDQQRDKESHFGSHTSSVFL